MLVCTPAPITTVPVPVVSVRSKPEGRRSMMSMLDPKTLTVFVTGVTSGFGEAICQRFHEAGAKVVGTGRRKERLEALKKQLGERCHVIELDVTD